MIVAQVTSKSRTHGVRLQPTVPLVFFIHNMILTKVKPVDCATHRNHQSKRSCVDDETKAEYHQPSENTSDYPVLPSKLIKPF